MAVYDHAVVGAGIIGLAVARELRTRRPDRSVVVLDKESLPGRHQTSRNSGVVHAGLYYPTGSLKARLCQRGRKLLIDFCAEHGVPVVECGKLVVATDDRQLAALTSIEERARANAVPELARLGPEQLREIEPHAAGVAALHSPHTAIVDFGAVADALAADLEVVTGFDVQRLSPCAYGTVVLHGDGGREVVARRVVVCAGLHSDRFGSDPAIVPFRGEYWRLRPDRAHLVQGLIYPVPDPRYPFLGVHFTRRVDGSVDLGPNAVLALSREGYHRRDVDLRFVAALARRPGFRRMARANWRAGAHEVMGSLSRRVFVARARRLVPDVTVGDVVPGPPGVRAQAVDQDGNLVDDFRFSWIGDRVLTVVNAPSPAATSSLAIAEHVVDLLEAGRTYV